jgi:ribosomal protein S8
MNLSKLHVFVNVLKQKKKKGISEDKYSMSKNKFVLEVVRKLLKENLISDLVSKNQKIYFRLRNLESLRVYPKSVYTFNKKNQRKVLSTYLENSPYVGLLISTSSHGILNVKEALEKNVGGFIIAKYSSRERLY